MAHRTRHEWDHLPGYLAAERISGEVWARWNSLGLFDGKTLEEFLNEPVVAIEKIMFERGQRAKKTDTFESTQGRRNFQEADNDRKLMELIARFSSVVVMAERQRVKAEEDERRDRQT